MVTLTLAGQDRTRTAETGAAVVVGRRTVRDPGQASYLSCTAWTASPAGIVSAGGTAAAAAAGRDRFAGRITDATLSHDPQPDGSRLAVQRITAMGPLADWGRRYIGDEPWPVESIADRARRLAALAGSPLIVQGGEATMVAARDVDRRRAGELLAELAATTGGWLFDYGGSVYLQALDHRRVNPAAQRWAQEPAGEPWAALAPDLPWADDDTGTIPPAAVLPCSAIDFQPVWSQGSAVVNRVRVEYGPAVESGDRATADVEDPDSIAAHGPQEERISTALQDRADALVLGNLILARAAWPQWSLAAVTVAYDAQPAEIRDALDRLVPGARLTVTGLPQPAPGHAFPGVVEGWQETFTYDEASWGTARTFTLYLSHILHSLAVPSWDAQPPADAWADLQPYESWEEDL